MAAGTELKNPPKEQADKAAEGSVEVQEAQLPEAEDQSTSAPNGQIDILLDAKMPLSVQLGQVSLLVRDLLRLGPGSVVALDRKVGEPVDVFLRDTKLATGQLVVVGDQLGVRIKEILSQDRQQVADMGEA